MATTIRRADLPGHLRGRFRHDPLMRVMNAGLSAWMWAEKFTHLPVPERGERTEFFEVEIAERRSCAGDASVVALAFTRPGGGELPTWFAGAHIDVRLPSGALRQYSLCGDPQNRSRYRIAVRLLPDGRGGSAEVHERLVPGVRVWISVPRNAFPLAVGGYNQRLSHVRLIAGGIGITPILPMLRTLHTAGVPWALFYCGRSVESTAFLDELAQYGNQVHLHFDETDGPASVAQLLTGLPDTDSAVYACGPAPMLDSIRGALADYPEVEFHAERFTPAAVVDGAEFELHLARTAETITVRADQTALDAILAVRPDATYSCRQGFCHSCAVPVLDRGPDSRSLSLNPAEGDDGLFLPCVSRVDGGLILDL
ncbi:PDR/VanB family oxidoreductase [Nocardia suismassiliense]|uniref:PDR/VanB family oxidoreductase n=1 Tax=Nocardia suismassiliense TaxID=2077092 RepID=A0ABW6R696_9NOCA